MNRMLRSVRVFTRRYAASLLGFLAASAFGVAWWIAQASAPQRPSSERLMQQAYCLPALQLGTGLTKISSLNTDPEASVVWSGWLRASATGLHSFDVSKTQKATVYIQNQKVSDSGRSEPIFLNLSSGKFYAIRIQMPVRAQAGALEDVPMLAWRVSNGEFERVAKGNLFPSMATVSDMPTAN